MNIGYYAHSHGTGHCRQADKLAALLMSLKSFVDNADNNSDGDSDGDSNNLMTVFTSMQAQAYHFEHIDEANVVRLPDENPHTDDLLPGRAGQHWQPECLHYSPVGSRNIQRRSQLLLSAVASRNIALMIIDLSVEVALLCRTASVPYLYVRLPGNRDDTPHRNAFEGAIGLLAAYPAILESADTPEWVRQKTLYLGFAPHAMSQFLPDGLFKSAMLKSEPPKSALLEPEILCKAAFIVYLSELISKADTYRATDDTMDINSATTQIVTVIKGFGGHQNIDNNLPKLRELMPQALIISLGPIEDDAKPYVDLALQVNNVKPFLQHSNLLVMACGLNAIGEACQFATPLLVMPDNRPHDEQEKMAQALVDCGRALTFTALEAICQKHKLSQNPSLNSSLSLKRPDPSLMTRLQATDSLHFMSSLALFSDIKLWFYDWLLPQLALKPDSL